jgi:hypothetical protein
MLQSGMPYLARLQEFHRLSTRRNRVLLRQSGGLAENQCRTPTCPRRSGVDGCPVARQHLETDVPRAEVVNDVDEVAPRPVELPDDESIPATQRLECGTESRPRVPPPGSRRSFHTANGTLTFKGENRFCDVDFLKDFIDLHKPESYRGQLR